jgi:hypothetical protein
MRPDHAAFVMMFQSRKNALHELSHFSSASAGLETVV